MTSIKASASALQSICKDLRYALRSLSRSPGFAITVVVTLALGIGATTAMFSVVNGILLKPLPYPKSDELVELVHEAPGLGIDALYASPAIYFAYREHNRTFESLGLWDWDASPVTVTGLGDPQSVQSLEVTHEILPILGAAPALGRGFVETDDVPGAAPTVIISHGYWQGQFGGAEALGRTIIVDGIPREIIGVLPQDFEWIDHSPEIFYPLQPDRSEAVFPSFDGRAIARLRAGVSLEEANADVARIIPTLTEEYPASGFSFENAQFRPKLRFLKDSVVGDLGNTLWLLMATIGMLLIISCGNVVNIVLVRTAGRRQELAIRAAMGAGWAGIARVVVAENISLAVLGGAAGLGVAFAALPILLSLDGADLPQVMHVRVDSRAALFALVVSIGAAAGFMFIPLIRFTGPGLLSVLRGAGRSVTENREGNRARQFLVVSQVALTFLLLVASSVMFRTYQNILQVDPGFRAPDEVQTFQLATPMGDFGSAEQAVRMYHAISDRLEALPGVEAAAFASFNDPLPLDGDGRGGGFYVEGRSSLDGLRLPLEMQFVSPGFFEALGTQLIAGRPLAWSDVYDRLPVALISQSLAIEEWRSVPGAIGQKLASSASGPWFEVVGVVQDVYHEGLNQPATKVVAFPLRANSEQGDRTTTYVVRSDRVATPGFLDEIRRVVLSINRDLALANPRTMGALYQRSMARTSMTLVLLVIAGSIALLLGLIGIYGVTSYAMSQRRREIGVRLALGAPLSSLRRLFVRDAVVLAVIGIAVGGSLATGLGSFVETLLFRVSSVDPVSFVVATVLTIGATMIASYLPARRASSLDPSTTLRAE